MATTTDLNPSCLTTGDQSARSSAAHLKPGKLIPLYGVKVVALYRADLASECRAANRVLKLERSPESVAFVQSVSAHAAMLAALRSAEIAVDQLCVDQHPENECWNVLRSIRAAIAKATGAAQ